MNYAVARHKHSEVRILEVRSATPADLQALRDKPRVSAGRIKKLHDRHHHMAWLIALGKSNIEVAAECRVAPGRIAQLKSGPALTDLIERYRREIEAARIASLHEFGARAARNMAAVEDIIGKVIDREAEKLAADPTAAVDIRTFNRISVDRMDRFGYGKHTTSESKNINVNFAAKLDAAIARSRRIS
jgi:hypothetical protein